MAKIDLLIIGGGSAGMAAAIQAKKEGVDSLLIVEKDGQLGGILNQCIHHGFGLNEFKSELTGPEYLSRFVEQVKQLEIPYLLNSLVINITKDKKVTIQTPDGIFIYEAKAIVFATGCFERSAGAIKIPGDRPNGVITAGTSQKYLNIHGYLVGKKIVILGSGDIGLIMARRLTLEGAKVECVLEIMPYSNGLNRNIVQCLNDYNIPLYLSTTVSKVIGQKRVEKIIASKVDENLNFIPGTEREIACDTLILSVGLIPYVALLKNIGVKMSMTKGPVVDEHLQTSIPGIFSCGNCLHVHDVVDFVTMEGRLAGHGAAIYLKGSAYDKHYYNVYADKQLSYVLPQLLDPRIKEDITIKFRVKRPVKNKNIIIKCNDKIITKIYKLALIPSEMVMVNIPKDKLDLINDDIYVTLEDR